MEQTNSHPTTTQVVPHPSSEIRRAAALSPPPLRTPLQGGLQSLEDLILQSAW